MSSALGQGDLTSCRIVRSGGYGVAIAHNLNRGSASIKVDLYIGRAVPLCQHIQVCDVVQSGSAGIGVGLKSLQGCELLKVANADTGRTINVQINSPLVSSYIESTFCISFGQISQ